jgi:hypothetical protein
VRFARIGSIGRRDQVVRRTSQIASASRRISAATTAATVGVGEL